MWSSSDGGVRHPVPRALAGVDALLDDAADAALWSLSDGQVAELTADAHVAVARVQALCLRLVAEADHRDVGRARGGTSTAGWLRGSLRMRPADASAQVHLAAALAGDRAATGAALGAGGVSREQAEVVVRAVDALPAGVGEDIKGRAERWLLARAAQHDPTELARLGRGVLQVIAPDAADELVGKSLDRDERRARARRFLRVTPDGEGGARLRGRADAEATARLLAVLDPLAAPRPTAADGPDSRTHEQRMADALDEAMRRLLSAGDAPSHGGESTTVVVTVPIQTLRDGVGAARLLRDGEPLSPGAARRLACDAGILPVVLGGASEVLDLGRRARFFTGRLRRALEIRDRGCAFPGCGRPPSWCTGHHIRDWHRDGPTAIDNGVLLCGHHHRLIHTGEWTVELGPDHHPWFRPPAWIDPERQPRPAWRAPTPDDYDTAA